MRHRRVDASGHPVKKGDVVRIIGTPDLSRMDRQGRAECEAVFSYLVGKYKTVEAFDRHGCAELSFFIGQGARRACHTVWIEPFLLRVRKSGKRRPSPMGSAVRGRARRAGAPRGTSDRRDA